MNRERILYVIPSLEVGGTERQLHALVRGLVEEYEVEIVCTRTEGALADSIREYAKITTLELGGGWDIRLRSRLHKVIDRLRPAIVHTFMFGFDYPVNRAARDAGVPVLLSSRRQLAEWKKPRHIRLQHKANGLVDRVVANSEAVARFASKQEALDPARISVIPNGIDLTPTLDMAQKTRLREKCGIPANARVVGIVANFSPVKDHGLFVKMAAELARRRPDIHFLMIGDGPLRAFVQGQLALLGLEKRCSVLKNVGDARPLFSLMDMSVLCSHNEGCPNAVMESMAAGIPVIASEVGGIPELIENGRTGYLIDSRDPFEFANAVESLLEDDENRVYMGEAAQARCAKTFSTKRMLDAYRELYTALLVVSRRAQTGT